MAVRTSKNTGVMFLCEVALGKENTITRDNPSLKKPPAGFDSVVARGSVEPGRASTALSHFLWRPIRLLSITVRVWSTSWAGLKGIWFKKASVSFCVSLLQQSGASLNSLGKFLSFCVSRPNQGHCHYPEREESVRPSREAGGSAPVLRQLLQQQRVSHLQRESVSHPLPAGAADALIQLPQRLNAPL